MDAEDASAIGARARKIRRRRGLSLDVVAGLAGISKSYLGMLEQGQRGFNRRGLIEDLAKAVGCSVADLTGQPYLPPDRASAEVGAAVSEISTALHDTTLTDVPDIPARPMGQLTSSAALAHAYADDASYELAGRGLAASLVELHIHAVTGSGGDRQAALVALVEVCKVAYISRQENRTYRVGGSIRSTGRRRR
jgi:transcriptional regulator with XRE-family HTH domain